MSSIDRPAGDVVRRVSELVSDYASTVDPVVFKPHTDLLAVGLDSLTIVRLLVAIEDEFDITFPDEMLTEAMFGTITSLALAVQAARDPRV